MINKIIIALAVSGFMLMPVKAAVSVINFDNSDSLSIRSIAESSTMRKVSVPAISEPKEEQVAMAKWNIMVYVNAKNNLEPFGLYDVNEMEAVGSTDKVKITVQLGRIRGYTTADGDWVGTRRYLIEKDNDKSRITSPVLQQGNDDMGDYKNMVEFVKWSKQNFPAEKYMLVFWNHGAGWKLNGSNITKGISYDDATGNHITTQQIPLALKEMGQIDIVAMDACLMQMVSIAYEMKSTGVKYYVASEETEPGDGWNYEIFLKKVAKGNALRPYDMAKMAVDAYYEDYAGKRQGITQSFSDVTTMAALGKLLTQWSELAMAKGDKTALKNAANRTAKYAYSDNKDLHHFMKNVTEIAGIDAELKAKSEEVMAFVTEKAVKHNRTYSSRYETSKGIAIYLPNYRYDSAYSKLAFAKDTKWADFLQWLVK